MFDYGLLLEEQANLEIEYFSEDHAQPETENDQVL